MPAPGFVNVCLPRRLMDDVDEQLKVETGVRSRAEFVRRAVARYLEDRPRKPAA